MQGSRYLWFGSMVGVTGRIYNALPVYIIDLNTSVYKK